MRSSQWWVTISGLVALGFAAWLVLRLWDTNRAPAIRPTPPTVSGRISRSVARVAGMVAASTVAGVLVLGFGGRLMMRVLAATSPDSAQGRITEAEEIVGEITLSGTVGFLLFVGVFGGLVGLALFVVLRRWLPERSVAAGSLGAAIGGGLLARPSGLLEPGSPDFAIVSPLWLAVLFALALIGTFGLLLAVLADRWSATWPPPSRSVRGMAGLVPLAPLLLFFLAGVVVAMTVVGRAALGPRIATPAWVGGADRVGRVAVAVLAVVGAGWMVVSAFEIVT